MRLRTILRRASFSLVPLALVACIPATHEMPLLRGANAAPPGPAGAGPDPAQCTVAGTYQTRAVDAHAEPSGCSQAHVEGESEGEVVTVTTRGDHATVAFNVTRGACEGGELHGCTLTTKCDVVGPGGAATMQLSWTFDRTGFTGSEDLTRQLTSGDRCRLAERVVGKPRRADVAQVAGG
jgi:hypothetical protein